MHCPNCATENPDQHKYCRSCGMELQMVSALLANHRSRSGALKPGKSEEEITFRSVKLIAGSFLTLCLGLLIALAGPRFFNQEFVPTVGGFLFLAGLLVFLFASFRLAWMKARPRRAPAMHEAITQSDLKAPTAASLAPPIPSITESTTRLMDDVQPGPRPQQTSGHQAGT
jgi:hypothetical protein